MCNVFKQSNGIDICEKMHYVVITDVTFGKSEDSDYEDIVCVMYTYWDSEEQTTRESSISFDHIYTSGKHRFQSLCREFGAIVDNELHLEDVPGILCMAEYHLTTGKLLRVPSDAENKAYKRIRRNFKDMLTK